MSGCVGVRVQMPALTGSPYYYSSSMPFLICQKHCRTEKTGSRAIASGLVCMKVGCQHAMKVICDDCESDHKQHSSDLLSIEDVSFLLERLLKLPGRQLTKPIGEALDVIKQVKLIKQFRKKIDALEKELQRQAVLLIEQTEALVQEVNESKAKAADLSALFSKIEEPGTYRQFLQNSENLLTGLAYNSKKDKLEFASASAKKKEQQRALTLHNAKEKIEELRDYSIKIVEVILCNNDSDSEDEDITQKRTHYESLKQEICLDSTQEELRQSQVSMRVQALSDRIDGFANLFEEKEIQTHSDIFTSEEVEERVEKQLVELRQSQARTENDLKLKLHAVVREKESMHRQISRWKEGLKQRKQVMTQLQAHAKEGRGKAQGRKLREDLVTKIIQIWNAADYEPQRDHQ